MTQRKRIRLPLRLKVLALVAGVLAVAISTYVLLAVTLITEDKLAYVYDLNRTLAEKLAVQVHAHLQGVDARLQLFGDLGVEVEAGDRDGLAGHIAEADPDILRLQLYERQSGARLKRVAGVTLHERLRPLELVEDDLAQLDQSMPLPISSTGPGERIVINRSLQPSGQLLSVVLTEKTDGAASRWVVVADFAHNQLLEIFALADVYRAYLVDIEGNVIAHPEIGEVVGRARVAGVPVVDAALSAPRASQGSLVFERDGRAIIGAFAPVADQRLHVIVEVDRDQALEASQRLVAFSIWLAAAILLVAILLSIIFARRLTKPILRLQEATDRVAQGKYDVEPDVTSRDEIGELAEAFARMVRELKQAQVQLVQSGKLAAVGQLGAGITHEVKNPLGTIRGFAELALMSLDDKRQVEESLQMIIKGATRSLDIVKNFLTFTRPSSGERESADLNEVVADGLRIINHQLGVSGVKLRTDYGRVPRVDVDVKQIQQIVLNLSLNAQQAMEEGGTLTVTTQTLEDGTAEVSIIDNGPGIPPEIQERIFEPFFTTKGPKEGTGLGLSISYSIMRDHGGELLLESEVGVGTTFKMRLPPGRVKTGELRVEPQREATG